eukprot:g7139.t1
MPSTRSLVRPEGSPSLCYCYDSHNIKQEDVVFVVVDLQRLAPQPEMLGKWDLFCLCDGHGGREAADFALANLPSLLASSLPTGPTPDTDTPQGRQWLREIRVSIDKAFNTLDLTFSRQCAFPNVGCTLTIALLSGWILTMANLGDSEAFLDLGSGKAIELTTSHKIDTNLSEQARLKRCGNQIRPLSEGFFRPAMPDEEGIGPLRVWPSGLAVSRAIGDQDCGHAVLASPHIKQIKIPFSGARLIIASDGLWDHLTPERVTKRSRKHVAKEIPIELIAKARDVAEYGLTDDTSVLVVDVVPTPKIDFKDISKKIRGPRNMISRLSKRLGRNKRSGAPSLILEEVDMANLEQTLPIEQAQFMSSKSIATNKERVHAGLTRFNTFDGRTDFKAASDSEEDFALYNEVVGASLNMDQDEGPSQSTRTRPLERFRSSLLD